MESRDPRVFRFLTNGVTAAAVIEAEVHRFTLDPTHSLQPLEIR